MVVCLTTCFWLQFWLLSFWVCNFVMPLRLLADSDSYLANTILISAKYAILEVDTPDGGGRIPVLEIEQGCIFSTTAIARYLARFRRDVGFFGGIVFDGDMIDSWIEFCVHESRLVCFKAHPWGLMLFCGSVPRLPSAPGFEMPEARWSEQWRMSRSLSRYWINICSRTLTWSVTRSDFALKQMVFVLFDMSFIVLVQVTIADIFVSCTIAEGTSTVFGSDFLQPCVNLRRWLEFSLKQPELSAVLGKSQFGAAVEKKEKAPMKAKPKKEAAPKEATAKKEIAGKACEFFCLDWNVWTRSRMKCMNYTQVYNSLSDFRDWWISETARSSGSRSQKASCFQSFHGNRAAPHLLPPFFTRDRSRSPGDIYEYPRWKFRESQLFSFAVKVERDQVAVVISPLQPRKSSEQIDDQPTEAQKHSILNRGVPDAGPSCSFHRSRKRQTHKITHSISDAVAKTSVLFLFLDMQVAKLKFRAVSIHPSGALFSRQQFWVVSRSQTTGFPRPWSADLSTEFVWLVDRFFLPISARRADSTSLLAAVFPVAQKTGRPGARIDEPGRETQCETAFSYGTVTGKISIREGSESSRERAASESCSSKNPYTVVVPEVGISDKSVCFTERRIVSQNKRPKKGSGKGSLVLFLRKQSSWVAWSRMSSRQNSCRFSEGPKVLGAHTLPCVRPRLPYQQPLALNTRRSTLGEHPTRHSFYMLDCSTFLPPKVHPQVVSPTTLWSSEARKYTCVKPLQEL